MKKETYFSIERLKEDLRELAEIGRLDDGGIHRMAFTRADMDGKEWLENRMRAAGLETRRDGAANVIGRLDGDAPDAPVLLLGSHIDTVPCAGILDGTLGVLTGLECLRALKEAGMKPSNPVELIAFSDEEGRFGGMFGSQAFAGLVTPESLHLAADLDGDQQDRQRRVLEHQHSLCAEQHGHQDALSNGSLYQ